VSWKHLCGARLAQYFDYVYTLYLTIQFFFDKWKLVLVSYHFPCHCDINVNIELVFRL
jgi:hypothetical protein